MAYLSLYRRWRPQVFSEVVGQEHIVRTLTNALDTGRMAHAYLFAGPRGTGKTTFARLVAKGLNCEHGPTGAPCDECDNCSRIARGSAVDVMEIDGASNRGIDEIRDLRDRVAYAPTEGRYKVYIIDEVHMLTNEAFNALLKVLEEPPSHVVFIFATTEAHKIPPTILSRCQKFDFRRFSPSQLAAHLKHVASDEKVVAEPQALSLIARHAEGSMRDALAVMDQCLSADAAELTVSTVTEVLGIVRREALSELVGHILDSDLASAVQLMNALLDEGVEVRQLVRDLTSYTRDLVLLKAAPEVPDLVVGVDGEELLTMQQQVHACQLDQLLGIVDALVAVDAELRWSTSPAMAIEIALVRAVAAMESRAATSVGLEEEMSKLAQRVAALEAAVHRGTVTPHQGAAESLDSSSEKVEAVAGASSSPGDMDTLDDGGELERLRSEWPSVLSLLKEDRMISTEAFLREGQPGAVDGQTVVIYFSPGHRFHQANIAEPHHKAAVEKVVSRVLGRQVTIRTAVGTLPKQPPQHDQEQSQESDDADESGPDHQAEIMHSPCVLKALEYLNGQVISIKEQED